MLRVFVSYSHNDPTHRERLEAFLKPLEREGAVVCWDDTRIRPGDDWESRIREEIARADVAVLLVSQDFIASDYVFDVEIPAILEKKSRGLRVFSVIISPSTFDWTSLSAIQTINDQKRSLESLGSKAETEQVWLDLVKAIKDLLDPIATPSAPPVSASIGIPGYITPFVGRVDLLSRLREALSKADRVALVGPPGMGKTRMASQYAREREAGEHPPRILWVDADSAESLASGLAELARELGLPEKNLVDQSAILAAVKAWLKGHPGWLLIFNNVDDLDLIKPHLPIEGGRILLTTREPRVHLVGARRLSVEKLTEEESARLILEQSGRLESSDPLERAKPADLEAALAIGREVGGLPLALEQAGAYIGSIPISPPEYLDLYRNEGKKLRARFSSLCEPDETGKLRDRLSVTTTFLLAFDAIRLKSPKAGDLLRLCALLDSSPIPEEVLAEGYTALGCRLGMSMMEAYPRNDVIEEASRLSLIRRDADSKTLMIHRLVQAVLRDLMEGRPLSEEGDPFAALTFITDDFNFGPEPPPDLLVAWARRAAGAVYLACPKTTDFAHWTSWDRLLPHALTCVDHIERMEMGHVAAGKLLGGVAGYLWARGQLAKAESLLRRSLEIDLRTAGEDHWATVSTQAELGNLLRELGKLDEAEALLSKALDFFRRNQGAGSNEFATVLNNLGLVLWARGRHAEAKFCFIESLESSEKRYGPDSLKLCSPLNNLASLHHDLGEDEEAEALYRRALRIVVTAHGPTHPRVGMLNQHLAVIVGALGRPAEAGEHRLEALRIMESIDPGSPGHASILHDLAVNHFEQGDYAEAERCCRLALAIFEANHGPDSPATLKTLLSLAHILGHTNREAEAESLLQRAVRTCEANPSGLGDERETALSELAKLLMNGGRPAEAEPIMRRYLEVVPRRGNSEDMRIAVASQLLAKCLQSLGRLDEAESLYRQSFEITLACRGTTSLDTARSATNLGGFYFSLGRHDEAEPFLRQSLEIRELVEPDVINLELANNLNNLALACHYHSQRVYEDAERLYRRAVAAFEQLGGPSSVEVYNSLNSLAELYRMERKHHEAQSIFQRVLEWCEQSPASRRDLMALCLNNMALSLDALGLHDEAERHFLRSLEIREEIYGQIHKEVIDVANNLAAHYRDLGKYDLVEGLYRRALLTVETALGPDHTLVADCLHQLACLLRDRDRLDESEALFLRALAIWESTLGDQHVETARSRCSLGRLRRKQGRIEDARGLFHRAWTVWNDLLGPDHPDTQMVLRDLQDTA